MIHTKDTLQVGAEFVKLALTIDQSTGAVLVKPMLRGWISDRFVEETISMGTVERASVVVNGSEIYETDMDLSAVSCENDLNSICVTPDSEAFYMNQMNFPNEVLANFYMKQMRQPHMEKQNECIHVHYGAQEILPNGQKTGIFPVYLK